MLTTTTRQINNSLETTCQKHDRHTERGAADLYFHARPHFFMEKTEKTFHSGKQFFFEKQTNHHHREQ